MKALVSLAVVLFASSAMADYSVTPNMILNGISYNASEACFDGTYIVTLVEKSRMTGTQNSEGEFTSTRTVTNEAGKAFMWRQATSFRDNGQGDSVPVMFTRNGVPGITTYVYSTRSDYEDGGSPKATVFQPLASCNF
jgi:hypothetical protein